MHQNAFAVTVLLGKTPLTLIPGISSSGLKHSICILDIYLDIYLDFYPEMIILPLSHLPGFHPAFRQTDET